MSKKYNIPTFPPLQPWDVRLQRHNVCENLQPAKELHANNWFRVFNRGGFFTIEPTQSHTIILPIINREAILMVRVFRPVINDVTLELPAGAFDPDKETPEAGAARELCEETGISIVDLERFKPLTPLSISPNRSPYLAYGFQIDISAEEFHSRQQHDHEIQSVERVSFEQAKQYILTGNIYVSVPIAMIGRYLLANY